MATLPIDYTFQNGQVANANHVNTNFQSIKTFVEASLVSTDGAVQAGTAAIANNAVTTAKILDSNITTGKIANDAVTAEKIAAGAVGASEIADGSVGTAELADGAVTAAKKSGFFGILYEDYSISGVAASDPSYPEFSGSSHTITLGAGRTYDHIVSVMPLQGVNSWLKLHSVANGGWANVLGTNQIIVFCSLGNTVAGNTGAIRVYYRA
jgi:hypothetical protein